MQDSMPAPGTSGAERPRMMTTGAKRIRWADVLAYAVLSAGGVFTIFPFVWMISTSLKADQYILEFPPVWIPSPIAWNNYVDVWGLVPVLSGFVNSLTVAVIGTAGTVMASSLAGFAFAKLQFPGRERLFLIALGSMMVPAAVLLIPQFMLFREFKWINTLLPLIVPSLFGGAYDTFFFRQFFRTLPDELLDAAKIDGAGFFRIFATIAVPLSTPVFATMTLLNFMGRWNDYLGPVIYLHDIERQTLPVLISTFQSQYISQYNFMMTLSVMSMIPIIILFLFTQRYFIEGITTTGLKG